MVNINEKFGIVIWDNIILANSAIVRVYEICCLLFDIIFPTHGVKQ